MLVTEILLIGVWITKLFSARDVEKFHFAPWLVILKITIGMILANIIMLWKSFTLGGLLDLKRLRVT